jgi:hypothetical protein
MPMRQFFDKDGPLSRKWNSPWFGVPLWCIGAAAAWWYFRSTPSPGKAIGALTVVAGVMSVREMKVPGRILWVCLLILFLRIEFRAINKDREENDAKQAAFFQAQQAGFKSIANQAKEDFKQTTAGLNSSIRSLSELLGATQKVVENVTGGTSFAYVYPSGLDPMILNIHNDGKQILSGVTVKIWPVVRGECGPGTADDCIQDMTQSFKPVEVGTLSPEWGDILPNGLMQPKFNPEGTASYTILIHTQNGGTTESLHLRRTMNGMGIAYRFDVWMKALGKRRPTDIWTGKQWTREVKKRDWTELEAAQIR